MQLSPLLLDASRDYQWNAPFKTLDVVNLNAIPSARGMLEAMYVEGAYRASSDALLRSLETLFELAGQKQFDQLEWLFQHSEAERLAPEFLVGMLRATANYVHWLPTWTAYRDATRRELLRRSLPADDILVGLGGEAN